MTDAYREFIVQQTIGEAVAAFNAANAHIGVGDSPVSADDAQTDLQASTNKLRKAMDSGYPIRVGQSMTFRSLFGTSEANFTWNEWGVFNAATGGVMMAREVEALGTKTSAMSWQLTVDISILTTSGS